MRVLIADDHPLYREAVQIQVERTFPGTEPVLAGSVAEAVAHLQSGPSFDLIMVDLVMPGMTASVGLRSVVESSGGTPVIVVSGSIDSQDVHDCIAAGAKGFLPKTLDPQVFASAVRVVVAGGTYVPAEYLSRPPAEASMPPGGAANAKFSERDVNILRMLAAGRSNKEIARELGVQEVTVKVNLTRLFSWLGARNRAQAAASAIERRLLPDA